MKKYIILWGILSFESIRMFAQSDPKPVQATDLLKIKAISGITLNSEGTRAAFTVNQIEPEAENKWDFKYVNHIYMVAADGSSEPQELTTREGASQPAWSPDGRQLAFVRSVGGKPQIFIMSLEGGEPVQFTHFRYGAATPKWSPDGKRILFSSLIGLKELWKDSVLNSQHLYPTWPTESAGLDNQHSLNEKKAIPNPDGNLEEIRAYLENDVADKKARVVSKLNFQDESGVNPELGFNHFFIQSLKTGSEPQAITHGFYPFSNADFTPDGKNLLITGNIDSSEHPDRILESTIFVADSDGNHLQPILGKKGRSYFSAKMSPSGKWLAFKYSATSYVSVDSLAVIPEGGTMGDMISVSADRSANALCWSPDSHSLYFTAASNGGYPLFRFDVSSRKTEQLSGFDTGMGSFDLRKNRLVFVNTAVSDPFELYTADLSLRHVRQISTFNSAWLKTRVISLPEKKIFRNDKGMTIEYWLMKPAGYQPGKKYPLLLEIHGGPAAMWGPGESTMWHEFQYYCSRGFGVVYCNPRGSGGYGQSFQQANVGDWGKGPAGDVLTALDSAMHAGWPDSSRLLITGGSYGGYLVAWIIGHDQRFKAACSQRGVYDLATFFGEGNAWRLVPNYFGGYPWERDVKQLLDRESPINYVSNMHTPYIIFHGENDRRTGVTQSEMLFRSLKVLGRQVEYVRHPGATHEITRSGDNRQRIDQLLRTYEFFERWLAESH